LYLNTCITRGHKLRLIDIATFIKKSGGSATILEERLVF